MKYTTQPNPQNRPGTAEGQLVGGNLKTIETLAGTRSDIDTAGKILFVEDTGEYLYSIDRMFWHLQRTGKLDRLTTAKADEAAPNWSPDGARIARPTGIAVGPEGSLFVSDDKAGEIYRIRPR